MTMQFTATLRLALLALVLPLLWPAVAEAADIHVSAEFVPNAHDPNKRTFDNTTPWSGLCSHPVHNASCVARGVWGIDTAIRGTKTTRGTGNRNDFYFGMPGARRITVTDAAGNNVDMVVRIVGMGYRIAAYNGSEGIELANCTVVLTNFGSAADSAMRLFHRNDDSEGASACWSGAVNNRDDRTIHELDIVYELETPNPLAMEVGIYTGSTTYSIGGAGMDIDLGDGVSLDDDTLTMHFTLEVKHAFRLTFPPGSDRVILSPRGGWSQWADHGRAPSSLEQQLPFNLDTSAPFSVSLQCEIALADGRCGLRNRSTAGAEDVPLEVTLTMPGVRDQTLGRDAVDYPLTVGMAAPKFTVESYVLQRPSRIGFAVRGEAVRQMLDHPGSHYQGVVTLLFDADL
ncbi:hypothetical protein [Stenotrophomonas rhizophila]|uniref:hypothetical protein n=1 Tax=Stenotrophomonas rhizophila TaxID=216778 RepID=UPI001E48E8C1|nr:hypothetical protein [Stenotrophomonas rhizophila]MCC7634822.1 hypothetical protein [Stenotrophomonas rhizophila]MCC7664505.1 hypothetical protein [Stenotrophomonas rhizophila]